jgi:DNA invertase Pin-like site-specific DNA recombinase
MGVTSTKNSPPTHSEKICFSYIRFSTGVQAKGDSQTRQQEIAPRVAHENGWTLRTDLNIADLGLSAYKKQNIGTLKAVQVAAKQAAIPQGSVMIVEALDRLTRADLDTALDLFRGILRAGLEIYVDKGRKHYTKESLNNPTDLLISILELNAANEYAVELAGRVKGAWQRKRDALSTGKKLTKAIPAWIDKNTWEPIPEKAAIVLRIFKLYASGHGGRSIMKQLNRERVPTMVRAKAWNLTPIRQILGNRAAIGEFTPCIVKLAEKGTYYKQIRTGQTIKDYYPRIIPNELFFRVQAKFAQHKGVIHSDNIRSLFAGIAYCAHCGARMNAVSGKTTHYLYCSRKVQGLDCRNISLPYNPVESAFKVIFMKVPALLATKGDNSAQVELEVLRGRLESTEKEIANISEALKIAVTKSLVLTQAELEAQVEKLKSEIEIAQGRAYSGNIDSKQVESILANLKKLKTDNDFRGRVREWVVANVVKMVFDVQKQQFAIQFRKGVRALYQFRNKYTEGEATFIPGLPKAS